MLEDIVHVGPMLLLAGLMTGWVTEAVSAAGGYGFVHDILLGLAGSVVAAAVVWVFISSEAGMVGTFLIACGGAALMIVAQRRFWRSARRGT